MKIILNKCYGGFGISDKGYELYCKKKNLDLYRYTTDDSRFRKINKESYLTYYFTKDFGESGDKKNLDWDFHIYLDSRYREDPVLIEVVEELGEEANGRYSNLQVVDIPDELRYNYDIDEYDGIETLHRKVEYY